VEGVCPPIRRYPVGAEAPLPNCRRYGEGEGWQTWHRIRSYPFPSPGKREARGAMSFASKTRQRWSIASRSRVEFRVESSFPSSPRFHAYICPGGEDPSVSRYHPHPGALATPLPCTTKHNSDDRTVLIAFHGAAATVAWGLRLWPREEQLVGKTGRRGGCIIIIIDRLRSPSGRTRPMPAAEPGVHLQGPHSARASHVLDLVWSHGRDGCH
jgi:hypothetical protein